MVLRSSATFLKIKNSLYLKRKLLGFWRSKEHIVWVVGYRMDDRCKVTEETEKVIKIKISI
jgi:hypothetical protein